MRETSKSHLVESDGRVFLSRHSEPYDLIMVDAFSGSYIPFHLMTKEFYQLIRDRLAPHGVAAFNIYPGTKLYDSSLITLKTVFGSVDLYNSGEKPGSEEVIAIAPLDPITSSDVFKQKAAATQARYKFRFDVTKLIVVRRVEFPKELKGELLTDDFAPVNLYDSFGRRYRRKE
jgi:spermidine synthase